MDLTALSIPTEKIKQLNKAGIDTVEDLLAYYPKKHIDRSRLTRLEEPTGESVILFHAVSRHYRNTKPEIVVLKGYDCTSKIPVHILWFNQGYLYNQLEDLLNKDILIAGQAVWKSVAYHEPDRYEFASPSVCDPAGTSALGMYPVYRKVRGMAEDYRPPCGIQPPAGGCVPGERCGQHRKRTAAQRCHRLGGTALSADRGHSGIQRSPWDQ